MKANNNWNYERWRTRDRLIDYDFNIVPPHPHSAGLPFIYPWENSSLSQLSKQIITLAHNNGYEGNEEDFWKRFTNDKIIFDAINNFPIPGDETTLYLDIETDILYYFKKVSYINMEAAAEIGIAIVGKAKIGSNGEEITYVYIPIKAIPIENELVS